LAFNSKVSLFFGKFPVIKKKSHSLIKTSFMMTRSLLFTGILLFTLSLGFSQEKSLKLKEGVQQMMKAERPDHTAEAFMPLPTQQAQKPTVPGANNFATDLRDVSGEVIIGSTIYDLQTNHAVCNRIQVDDAGNVGATWTMGMEPTTYPNRGTGFNSNAGGSWGPDPSERLEDGVRTGWPNYVKTESGTEFIVAHVFDAGSYRLHTLRREAGETDWTEGDMPTNTNAGVLWPRMAVDGENVHVIAITPTDEIHLGMEFHVLYYRSTDGGENWDQVDAVIPGLDSTLTKDLFTADCYSIDARDGKVAVGVFSPYADIKIFESEDNGDNWNETRVRDFPIDGYVFDQGITEDDLPPWDSTFAPSPISVYSTDGSANVLIDLDGKVHAFFTDMFIGDETPDDGFFNFWLTSGISYWNNDFGADSSQVIAGPEDLNENDVLDVAGFDEVAAYSLWNATTNNFPSAGVDDLNNIYLSYSALMEGEDMFYNIDDAQHYWHIYLMASEDGGASWTEPFDMINEEISEAGDLFDVVEASFPHMARKVDDQMHLVYQRDFRPGLSVNGDEDDPETQDIIYAAIDVAELGIIVDNTKELEKSLSWNLYPNPAIENVFMDFELDQSAEVQLEVVNMIGSLLRSEDLGQLTSGYHQQMLDLDGLTPGIYLLRLNVDGESVSRKLVVQ
jgi:hypothetical protein